jgi:hypothetical protein
VDQVASITDRKLLLLTLNNPFITNRNMTEAISRLESNTRTTTTLTSTNSDAKIINSTTSSTRCRGAGVRTSMELTAEDHSDIERHIFEELPPEHTDLISKVCKILPLEQESDRCEEIMKG